MQKLTSPLDNNQLTTSVPYHEACGQFYVTGVSVERPTYPSQSETIKSEGDSSRISFNVQPLLDWYKPACNLVLVPPWWWGTWPCHVHGSSHDTVQGFYCCHRRGTQLISMTDDGDIVHISPNKIRTDVSDIVLFRRTR